MARSLIISLAVMAAVGCAGTPAPDKAKPEEEVAVKPDEAAKPDPTLTAFFKALPADMATEDRPVTPERVALGRALYHEKRLSKNHDISCNSCHQLDNFGVDNEPTSPGHKGQRGGRNSPTTYNAGIHLAQFWDGRAADVEAQAVGPITNPIEMAMPDEATVVRTLKSIPGYQPMFAAAFPGEEDPMTYANIGMAIGAFERTLVTPGKWDAYLAGDGNALTAEEVEGAKHFVATGCTTCHRGPAVGGTMYQKLGLAHPYETKDEGRKEVTGNEADLHMFKVPSLRNIAKTGPYFHDGSVATLDEAIKLMGHHQLGKDLTDEDVAKISTFLNALTAEPAAELVAVPELPESGPDTPKADPS